MVQTTAGDVSATRDFPSEYTIQVDRLLGEIFKTNPAVTGIKVLVPRIRTLLHPMIRIGRPTAKRMRGSKRQRRGVN